MFGPFFAVLYVFMCCNHHIGKRESVALLYCAPGVFWLLVFCGSSSQYYGLVCSV